MSSSGGRSLSQAQAGGPVRPAPALSLSTSSSQNSLPSARSSEDLPSLGTSRSTSSRSADLLRSSSSQRRVSSAAATSDEDLALSDDEGQGGQGGGGGQSGPWADVSELSSPWLAYAQRWPSPEAVLSPTYIVDDKGEAAADDDDDATTRPYRALTEPSCEALRDRIVLSTAGANGAAGPRGLDGQATSSPHATAGSDGEAGVSARDLEVFIESWEVSTRTLTAHVIVGEHRGLERWTVAVGERLVLDASGGSGGSGGQGGDGLALSDPSTGGRAGFGGNGGWGGCGGHGAHVVVAAMNSALFALLSVRVRGGEGGAGGKGGRSAKGSSGEDGEPGARGLDGRVEWRFLSTSSGALLECAPQPFALRVSEVRLETSRKDRVLAPGDAVSAVLSVENAGSLALPAGVVLSVLSSPQIAWHSVPLSVTLPALAPAQRLGKVLTLKGALVHAPALTAPMRLEGVAYVPLRATLLDAPLRSACVVNALAVRCPLIVERVELPSEACVSAQWPMRVHVHNRSAQKVQGARVRVTVDERTQLIAPTPDPAVPERPWTARVELPLPELSPDSTVHVSLTCALSTLAVRAACARVPLRVELLWNGSCSELQEPSVRVVPDCTWVGTPVDVVALLGAHAKPEHVMALGSLCSTLQLSLGLWDVDYHGKTARASRSECTCTCSKRSSSSPTWSEVSARALVLVLGDSSDPSASWVRSKVDWAWLARHIGRGARWATSHQSQIRPDPEASGGSGSGSSLGEAGVIVFACPQSALAEALLSDAHAVCSDHAILVDSEDHAPAMNVNDLRARASAILADLRAKHPHVAHKLHTIERALVKRADGSFSAATVHVRSSPVSLVAALWSSESPAPSSIPISGQVPLEYAHALVTLLCALPIERRLTRPLKVQQWPLALDPQSVVSASLVRELQLDALYRVHSAPWAHLAALNSALTATLSAVPRDPNACALVRYALHAQQATLEADALARPLVHQMRTALGHEAREEAQMAAMLEAAVRAPPPPLPPPTVLTLLSLGTLPSVLQDEKEFPIVAPAHTSHSVVAVDAASSLLMSRAAGSTVLSGSASGGHGHGHGLNHSSSMNVSKSAKKATHPNDELDLILTELAEEHGADHTMLGVACFGAREVSAKELRVLLKIGEQKLKTPSKAVPENGVVAWNSELIILVRGSYADSTMTLRFRDDAKGRNLGELHWHMRTLRAMQTQPAQWHRLGQGTTAEALLQVFVYDRKEPRPPRLDRKVKVGVVTEDAVMQSLGIGTQGVSGKTHKDKDKDKDKDKKDRERLQQSQSYERGERRAPAGLGPLRESASDAALPTLPERDKDKDKEHGFTRSSSKAAQLMGLPSTSNSASPSPALSTSASASATPSSPRVSAGSGAPATRVDKASRLMGLGGSDATASAISPRRDSEKKDKDKDKKDKKDKDKKDKDKDKDKEKEKDKDKKEKKEKQKAAWDNINYF